MTPIDDTAGHTIYYDEDRKTYHTWCDDADDSAITAVVAAIASALEVEPDELDPLSDAIDPDALDALVDHWRGTARASDGAVTFPFADHSIAVRSSGEVVIEPIDRRVRASDD
ncbi:HalOD1 output domain-containing protein [Haloterrigena salinisoli]|uniref:HalOD1 output domain-containing protein n=1 Tax=Haloterrigena salinisoli TaxID=3132747 RepID=UPI0030D121F9